MKKTRPNGKPDPSNRPEIEDIKRILLFLLHGYIEHAADSTILQQLIEDKHFLPAGSNYEEVRQKVMRDFAAELSHGAEVRDNALFAEMLRAVAQVTREK